MKKYRISFYDPGKDGGKHYDVEAEDADSAFSIACGMPEAKQRLYSEAGVEEVPEGPSSIGIRFSYDDHMLKRKGSNYMCIFAEDEAQAVAYYDAHYLGKRFFQPWPHKPDAGGNCTYGKVLETYFACGPGYDADATGQHADVAAKKG